MSTGSKITCVFVHGWAMNSVVWKNCLAFLPDWIDVVRVDLPGYGSKIEDRAETLNDYAQALRETTGGPVLWVGWSLGGLAVLRLARLYPECVAGLFLVSTNPCFVRKRDWQSAVEADVFEQFARALQSDADATVKRFLALQVKGSNSTMKTLRELQLSIKKSGKLPVDTLKLGLDILLTTDLRAELSLLRCPITWLLGARDKLVPATVAEELKILSPEIEICIESEAAHVPFISHPQTFVKTLLSLAEKLR
jgi:pimeloyl-[acyl-carrier protein] methyl ester esterase